MQFIMSWSYCIVLVCVNVIAGQTTGPSHISCPNDGIYSTILKISEDVQALKTEIHNIKSGSEKTMKDQGSKTAGSDVIPSSPPSLDTDKLDIITSKVSLIARRLGIDPMPRSCAEVTNGGTNQHILIDADGEGPMTPFPVQCDFSVYPPRTMISHSQQTRSLVNGFESKGSYVVNITYAVPSPKQIAYLKNKSSHCSQVFKYECYHSTLSKYGWLVGANGLPIKYWENQELGKGCDCAKSKTCVSGQKWCNCDKNDMNWRTDHITVTDKTLLPISRIHLGDTGTYGKTDERAYFTLTPLMCSD